MYPFAGCDLTATPLSSTTPPASSEYGAYFAVSYGKSVVDITYTNMAGDSSYDLSKISKQVEIDASGIGSAKTLDITDACSGICISPVRFRTEPSFQTIGFLHAFRASLCPFPVQNFQ